jgi:hypothetical protein
MTARPGSETLPLVQLEKKGDDHMLASTPAAPSIPAAIVQCAYDSSHCAFTGLGLTPGTTYTFTKQQLADACKGGGFAAVGTSNQGRCVSFVEQTFPSGTSLTVPNVPVGGLRSGDGGLIANIVSDGNGGLIANLTSDGNGGLIAN